jgi:hypothetical protein
MMKVSITVANNNNINNNNNDYRNISPSGMGYLTLALTDVGVAIHFFVGFSIATTCI